MTIRERLRNWLGIEARQIDRTYHGYFDTVFLGPSKSGVTVTADTAFAIPAVHQAVTVIAREVATLPLEVWRDEGDTRTLAELHPAYPLLRWNANPEMTAFQWRETAMVHVLLYGNAFTEIQYDAAMRPRALWLLHPHRVQMFTDNEQREVLYKYQPLVGPERSILPDDMIHIRATTNNTGLWGESLVQQCMDALGLTQALQDFGSRFFGNGAHPNGLLEHPGQLSDEAYEALKNSWQETHGGVQASHKVAILEEGMTWKPTTMDPERSQMLGSREFQIAEVARIFNLPTQRIGGKTDPYTYSSQEQEARAFYTNSIRPWLTRWEMELNRKLLPRNLYADFNMNEVLRADTSTRFAAYQTAIAAGWMLPNEVREAEGLNPIPGLDEAATEPEPEPEPPAPEPEDEDPEEDGTRFRPILLHTVERVLTRQVRALTRARDKEDSGAVARFLDGQPDVWANELAPVLSVIAESRAVEWLPGTKAVEFGTILTERHAKDLESHTEDLSALWNAEDITEELSHDL
jgi:HK97 family phage portal protein